ncbi:ABC transporter ATP-binding protein [Jannaschia seohaensis]|uniref:Branched-chain amino acid transport system ATP-binding protein n=1 Tax=Jannaschia seohaensis TaxID=475081 RepID=A0A2Y9B1L8_9RHOB|nr:ABC transporter ATP-binding protein [Jannaschia seohaensis]PWJ13828.1 branched-chain amino acid transport system ATP-binding protein [Jannaschia seohaensis]SSA50341.1 branched-chain amino acid transport system ATP-binding protein [Jannaschia seohaensis]
MLEIRDIKTSYGKIAALKGVSLDIRDGGLTCLLGPNGAGKTTLIWTIAGILKAQSGSIKMGGDELAGLKAHQIVEKGVVTVPENRLVFPEMTVTDNLIAGAFSRRKEKGGVSEDLEAVLERFPRLRERATQEAGTLSGGEQQMLAVGRALMARPKILLMDEPSTGLAPIIVEEIFEIIGQLRDEGRTIFLVEQNANLALDYADHFYLLEQGQVTFGGDPGEVDHDELIARAYLGARKAS